MKKNYTKELMKDDTCFGFLGMISRAPGFEKANNLFRSCAKMVNAAVPGGENGEMAINIMGEMGECMLESERVGFNAGVKYGMELSQQPARVVVKTSELKRKPVRVIVKTKLN